jgi:hypothetical protein
MFPRPSRVSFLPLIVLSLQITSPRVFAQDVSRLELAVKDKVSVTAGLMRSVAITRPVCDGAGNIYTQFGAGRNPGGPVTRISSDGQQVTTFSLSSASGLSPDASIDNFAVTPGGEVFALGSSRDAPQLFTFRDDGQFDSAHKLDVEISSSDFAVFPTGELLLRGTRTSGSSDKQSEEVFTGLFDRYGNFVKQITLENETKLKDPADYKDRAAYIDAYDASQQALTFSQALPAEDGNVYLLRSAKPLSVDVVSAGGEIVRRLTLKPPSSSLAPGIVKVAGGQIAVEFFPKDSGDSQDRTGSATYSVFDAETGDKLVDYYWAAAPGGIFACYTPNDFTFVKPEPNGLTLIHAAAR